MKEVKKKKRVWKGLIVYETYFSVLHEEMMPLVYYLHPDDADLVIPTSKINPKIYRIK